VIEDVLERSVGLITVEPSVEHVCQDRLATTESVQELALPNVHDPTEPSELAVGTDAMPMDVVELAPTVTLATSVAEMELANVFPTVTTNTAVMTDVEDPVELAKVEPSAKEQLILIPINVTSTVTLKSVLRSENSRPTLWLQRPVLLLSLAQTVSLLPTASTQDLLPDISLLMFRLESMEITNFQPTVLDISLILRLMRSMFQDNW